MGHWIALTRKLGDKPVGINLDEIDLIEEDSEGAGAKLWFANSNEANITVHESFDTVMQMAIGTEERNTP